MNALKRINPASTGLRLGRRHSPTTLSAVRSLATEEAKIAIVGSGPAGFYAAQHLLRHSGDFRPSVDVYERLPVPFGLVRYGVAPDHPDVKNVDHAFSKTAKDPRVRFLGNVAVGSDVKVSELRKEYHAVILAYGAAKDRELGVPGESLKNVVSARTFVGLYNGLPEVSSADVRLDLHDTACVVGLGNVALDVARILLTPVDVLRKTDMTEAALECLSKSRIRNVRLIGRRGPLHVAFTIKEFREMLKIPDCRSHLKQSDFVAIPEVLDKLKRPRKRLTELMVNTLREQASVADGGRVKGWHLDLLRTPTEILASRDDPERIAGVKLGVNRLAEGVICEEQGVEPTGESEVIECGILLRSIGYKSVKVEEGVPYDEKKGLIPNVDGKVEGHEGLYCAGWLATGPRGVIGDTMTEAFQVAKMISEDLDGLVTRAEQEGESKTGYEGIRKLFDERNIRPVTFSDWERIDALERLHGKASGKPREKMTDVREILENLGPEGK